LSAIYVTPVVVKVAGIATADRPCGYVMTIVLGQAIFQGVRFTALAAGYL
jgi:hypothetical protein